MPRKKTEKKAEHPTLASAINSLKKSLTFYTGMGRTTSGILPIDDLFGGGIPQGKIIEFSSREGIGKSTVMLHVARGLCQRGHNVLYIDSEFGVTPSMLEGIGLAEYVDQRFFLVQENRFAKLSDALDTILQHPITFLVIDSFTALRASKLSDINVEDVQPGLKARLQGTFLEKYTDTIANKGICMILLNQMRTKLNFRGMSSEGPAGGNALKFYTDARFVIRRLDWLERTGEDGQKQNYGSDCEIEPLKNRLGPSRKMKLTIIFGVGVSNVAYVQARLKEKGYMEQSSSYFGFKTPQVEQTVQGRQAAMDLIKANYDYFVSLISQEVDETPLPETSAPVTTQPRNTTEDRKKDEDDDPFAESGGGKEEATSASPEKSGGFSL